jgi:hypothetical protein
MSSVGATGGRRLLRLTVGRADAALRRDRTAQRVALVSGGIFVVAGLVKFVFHGWELHAFRSFGLPAPQALVILAGALETAGGVLLLLRRFVAPVAAVLAVTMAVAVAASGIGHGDVIPSLRSPRRWRSRWCSCSCAASAPRAGFRTARVDPACGVVARRARVRQWTTTRFARWSQAWPGRIRAEAR